MKKRNFLSSPFLEESKRKRRKVIKKKITTYFLVFLIIFIGLAFLSRWEKTNIENIEVEGNSIADSFLIVQKVKEEISGDYVWFFPKANFLIYPREKIKNNLANEFKILKDISVNLKGLKTLSIKVSERRGEYTWCGNVAVLETSENYECYFMDETGYIFDKAPYFSGDVYLKFFGRVLDNGEIPLGSQFFPEIFSQLLAFKKNIKDMGIDSSSFFVKDDGDIELYLSSSLESSSAPKIIFKKDADLSIIAENLQTAIDTEPLKSEFGKKYSSLNYVDLRFGNKVFYKFKE